MKVVRVPIPIFLQPVDVPERCLLKEVLFWVAFQRLPIAAYTLNGKEVRDSDEVDEFEKTDSVLTEDETARAGIPADPDWVALSQERTTLYVASYDHLLSKNDLDDEERRKLEIEREAAIAYEKDRESWTPHYERAIEYPTSRIFVALRDGSLRAKGRSLPGADIDIARSKLDAEGRDIFDLALTDIPPTFWSLRGIDFDANTAANGTDCYCYISCRTDDMLSVSRAREKR
jgi:hypothetical protein